MTKGQLRKMLLDSITEDEWAKLEWNKEKIFIGEFNRNVLLRMRDYRCDMYEDVPDGKIGRLYALLKRYLEKYMPDGWKGTRLFSVLRIPGRIVSVNAVSAGNRAQIYRMIYVIAPVFYASAWIQSHHKSPACPQPSVGRAFQTAGIL